MNPDCSRLGLIKSSLTTKETTWHGYANLLYSTLAIFIFVVAVIFVICQFNFHFVTYSENRYLLFLTENYAALEILRHYLHDVVRVSSTTSISEVMTTEEAEPFILFGSSFPKDKDYTQVIFNRILCFMKIDYCCYILMHS